MFVQLVSCMAFHGCTEMKVGMSKGWEGWMKYHMHERAHLGSKFSEATWKDWIPNKIGSSSLCMHVLMVFSPSSAGSWTLTYLSIFLFFYFKLNFGFDLGSPVSFRAWIKTSRVDSNEMNYILLPPLLHCYISVIWCGCSSKVWMTKLTEQKITRIQCDFLQIHTYIHTYIELSRLYV